MRTADHVDLPLLVDASLGTDGRDRRDLRQQVAERLREVIRNGSFMAGQRLPSSRSLAAHLGVSRATVVAAVAELDGEGWVESRHGSGTYVAAGIAGAQLAPAAPSGTTVSLDARPGEGPRPGPVIDLIPGRPDTIGLVDPAWRRAWREASSVQVSPHELPLAGLEQLRAVIAEHVRRTRGLVCGPQDIVVTAGAGDAIRLLADAYGVAGGTAAVEEPGYPAARDVLTLAGARLYPVAVDDDGVMVDALSQAPADTRLLYVTPSHQYPLGGRLPVDRRLAVLRWATERQALVLEDDYDGEFRFGAAPVPALASLDTGGQVAYVGTLSKVMSPGLRVAYVVASAELIGAVLRVRRPLGMPVSEVAQRAVASYIGNGGLRRHVARQRRLYAERRARLVRRLAGLDGVTAVRGLEAGLHAVVSLTPDRAAAAVVAAAAAAGVLVSDLDEYRLSPEPSMPGFVLGYGHASPADLDRALERLGAILR